MRNPTLSLLSVKSVYCKGKFNTFGITFLTLSNPDLRFKRNLKVLVSTDCPCLVYEN